MEPLSRADSHEWTVVEELYPFLRRFAAVVAPPDLEPDDLLQEALVGLLRRRSLSEIQHPSAYLKRSILNAAKAHSRGRSRWRRAMTTYTASSGDSTVSVYPSDLDELLRLPTRERATLYLHEVEGYRFSEISRMLGCSEAAARKAASRGRKRLGVVLRSEVTS
jgi:RNA polymerase sigma factor (sigma-70 family)